MKVFISADIEGVAGITQWQETESGPWYDYFCQEMTREVATACRAAFAAGATEVFVKDGHHSACNLIPHLLPKGVVLHRGWKMDGYGMMSGVQECDVAVMIGYHAASSSNQHPLAHTSEAFIRKFELNEQIASEFLLNRYTAGFFGVPVVFLSGDAGICAEVAQVDPAIGTFATSVGNSSAAASRHPEDVEEGIYAGVFQAISERQVQAAQLPDDFVVRITYQEQRMAQKASLFPGAVAEDPYTVRFETTDWWAFLQFYTFVA